jgi:hypothetical protein
MFFYTKLEECSVRDVVVHELSELGDKGCQLAIGPIGVEDRVGADEAGRGQRPPCHRQLSWLKNT